MRTTVDIPPELHQQALALARDTARTLSDVVAELMRKGLRGDTAPTADVTFNDRTGFPQLSVGRVVTTEDVRSLEDEE
ncbi:antitoxin [Glycomyces xiaoerkulensis]|uniref:antitoxin n=1 Tax=Glycomyces xiaoerkulensis TaxID=2038139 RepID=UPI000C263E75|nr:antitoxin [Glycomyces xiaoerkulensis]